jgi:hypothetical protein
MLCSVDARPAHELQHDFSGLQTGVQGGRSVRYFQSERIFDLECRVEGHKLIPMVEDEGKIQVRQALRTLLVWVIITVALYVPAVKLTILISSVHGRPPFARADSSSSDEVPVQVISVYLNPETEKLSHHTEVQYRIGDVPRKADFDTENYAFMEIRIPAEAKAKIWVNNLRDK